MLKIGNQEVIHHQQQLFQWSGLWGFGDFHLFHWKWSILKSHNCVLPTLLNAPIHHNSTFIQIKDMGLYSSGTRMFPIFLLFWIQSQHWMPLVINQAINVQKNCPALTASSIVLITPAMKSTVNWTTLFEGANVLSFLYINYTSYFHCLLFEKTQWMSSLSLVIAGSRGQTSNCIIA